MTKRIDIFNDVQQTKTGKLQWKNANGTSRFWNQIDSDTIVSPMHRAYEFQIIGTQDLSDGTWTFEMHFANGSICDMKETTPQAAEAFYKEQR